MILENLENAKGLSGIAEGWDLSSMRNYMFFLAIVGVGLYQYFKYKNKKR